jgi:molecular chaperone GrpE
MSEKKQNSSNEKNFKQLEKTLKDLEKTAEEYLNGWKRSRADYLNREREIETQKQNWIKFANQELILKILPVLDSFDHLLKNHHQDIEKNEWLKGVEQIKKQLEEVLEQEGLKRIKTRGEDFNPVYHEVMEKRGDSEKIIEEIQAGYLIGERVIRPAKVIIK